MNSVRPYLIRALIDWIVDNECTPYMAISCTAPGVDVPAEYATDDKLVLNISATATRGFSIAEERVDVDCRFRGQPVHISVPVGAVVAVYARGKRHGHGVRGRDADAAIATEGVRAQARRCAAQVGEVSTRRLGHR